MAAKTSSHSAALKAILVLSGVVTLSALATLAACMIATSTPWFLLGFEMVVLVASAFGVLLGLGRVSEALPLAALCVAGGIGAASFLGYLGAGKSLVGVGAGSIPLFWWAVFRVISSVLIACCGGAIMIARKPAIAIGHLVKGVLCGVACVVLAVALWSVKGRLTAWNLPDVVMAMGGLVVLTILLGLLAASVHLCVRAFEVCANSEPELEPTKR